MDAASRPTDPANPSRANSAFGVRLRPVDDSTPLLDAFFSGNADRYRSAGSLVYGIVGVLVFAIGISAVAGSFLVWADRSALTFYGSFLIAAAVYPTVIVTLQFFASCQLPLALRLSLVYAAVFACLRALTFGEPATIEGPLILCYAPICIGGFLQHRFGGWSALPWGQKAEPPGKISIATLLDLTAAVAITMGIASTAKIDPESLSVMILPWLIMAAVGMHGWGRLTSLCAERTHRDVGFAIWMVGSAIWACGIFLIMVLAGSGSPAALLGFVIGPLVVLVAHLATAIPIAWLKACGWRFVRTEAESAHTTQAE